MAPHQVVLDTNVLVSALLSKLGASHKLLSLVGVSERFEINVSVPLVFEYEDVLKRQADALGLSHPEIDDVLDYLCSVAHRRRIFFLWRTYLRDPKDEFVLELAVEAGCEFIATYNQHDFAGIERFGIRSITPREFLRLIEVLP
jgi:putative PIN family toxin of toxin-antitoxin system